MENKIIFNYRKLLGRIKEKFGTQEEFAKALGIGRVSLSQRLNCKLEFSQGEILKAMKLLDLEKFDIPMFFFTEVNGMEGASKVVSCKD